MKVYKIQFSFFAETETKRNQNCHKAIIFRGSHLNKFELDDISGMNIIDKLVLKLIMTLRVSQKYGVLQLSYYTTRYFNSISQVAIQRLLSDWAQCVQFSGAT